MHLILYAKDSQLLRPVYCADLLTSPLPHPNQVLLPCPARLPCCELRCCKSLLLSVYFIYVYFALVLICSNSTPTYLVWLQRCHSNSEVLNHHCDLEHSNQIFSQHTSTNDDVPSKSVWLQNVQQFWRYKGQRSYYRRFGHAQWEHSLSKAKLSITEHGHHMDRWLLCTRLCALRFLVSNSVQTLQKSFRWDYKNQGLPCKYACEKITDIC